MFRHSGQKIKVIAIVMFILSCIAAVTFACVYWFGQSETKNFWIGLAILVGGLFASWLGALQTYALGQAADRAEAAAEDARKALKQMGQLDDKVDSVPEALMAGLKDQQKEKEKEKEKKKEKEKEKKKNREI